MQSIRVRSKIDASSTVRNFSTSKFRLAAWTAERPSDIRHMGQPIGIKELPLVNDNTGIDGRDLKERWRDFKDPQKNRIRREELKEELRKTAYSPVYGFRHTGGKFFTSPKEILSEKSALYMPNIHGKTVEGIDTSLVQLLQRAPSLIRIFSSDVAEKQTSSFANEVDFQAVGWSLVDINIPTSWTNEKLVRLFSSRIQNQLRGDFHRYLISRAGVTPALREKIWADNVLGGYVYVVDSDLKIRWAGSGEATQSEKNLLRKITREL